jgi:arylsulfatase A-like enzyme
MTATEPDFALVEVASGESSEPAATTWLGLAVRAVLGSTTGVVLGVLFGLLGVDGSYAGARDDAAVDQAVATYGLFLDAVGRTMAGVAIIQALALAPVVFGLLLLAGLHPRASRLARSRVALPVLLGLLSVFAFFVWVAHRHPGLFLPLLASSRLLTLAARWGHVVGALVFGAAALGYILTVIARRRQPGVVLGCAAVVLLPAAVWLGPSLVPPPDRVFGAPSVAPLAPAATARPNILVIAVDSLRPDMIDPEHTPHLSRLLAESVYFPNTLVTLPRTGPSWAATLTSLSPLVNGIETMFPNAALGRLDTFSLPAHLASLGYRTAVFSEYAGEFFTRASFGFQVTSVPQVELKDISGQMLLSRVPTLLAASSVAYNRGPLGRAALGGRVTNLIRGLASFASPEVMRDDMLALARIDRSAGEKAAPFFWLTFYSQPHFPYTSSSEFYPDYEVDGASPELRFGRDAATETPVVSPEDRAQLAGLYRAALAETDAAIGDLLEHLRSARLLDDTIIVLLADHGEGLYECPTCFGHGDNLESMLTLRVPLAFRLPRSIFPAAEPRRQEVYVSQLDIYPTLLRLLGQPAMPQHEGLAVLDAQGHLEALPAERTFFAESGEWLWPTPAVPADRLRYPVITEMAKLEKGRIVIDPKYNPEIRAGKHRAVIRPPYKLRYEPGARGVRRGLYDFEKDPYETTDLAPTRPELAAELERALSRSMLRHPKVLRVGDYFLSRPEPPPPESL